MRASIVAALVLSGLVPARADVLVVDASHFTTIQAAVNAALPGDTILVDWTFDTSAQDVVIDGKGINLFVDTPAKTRSIHKLVIRNVPAGQRMSVAGLVVPSPGSVALEFLDNAGELRLYDVGGTGKPGEPQTATQPARPGFTGAIITNCADIVWHRGGAAGGKGGDVFATGILATSDGGTGAIITNSKLACYFTGFGGGKGGKVVPIGHLAPGGAGGTGIASEDSTLFFAGYLAGGGAGGDAQWGTGGTGGTAFIQSGATAQLITYAASVYGGQGGNGGFGDAPDGEAKLILEGTATEIGPPLAPARDLYASSPVREGEPVIISAYGFNDDVWVLMSLDTGHHLMPGYAGVLTVSPPFLVGLLHLGILPVFQTDFVLGPAPELPPGFDLVEVHIQGVMKLNGSTEFTLAAPHHIVVLDAGF
jgi:hypothetical protein